MNNPRIDDGMPLCRKKSAQIPMIHPIAKTAVMWYNKP